MAYGAASEMPVTAVTCGSETTDTHDSSKQRKARSLDGQRKNLVLRTVQKRIPEELIFGKDLAVRQQGPQR